MLDFKAKNNAENLVLFIHGFIGGEDTWVRKDGKTSIMEYLIKDTGFVKKFDIATFTYFTKIADVFSKKRRWISKLLGKSWKNQRNLAVKDLSDLLATQIETQCSDYKKIILVAHSMGGLVSKSYIIKSKFPLVDLYISLAVPHNGSNLAALSRAIFNNPQISDLAPLGDALNDMNREWIKADKKLPRTVYFEGKNDDVVLQTSALGMESRPNDYFRNVHSEDDHFSIVAPDKAENIVVLAIKQECWSAINPKPTITDKIDVSQQLGKLIKVLPTTEEAIQSESLRKELIKKINLNLNEKISKDFKDIVFFKRNFRDQNNNILTLDDIRQEIINSDAVMISGIGGIGKSLTIKKLMVQLSNDFREPFFIYCEAKNWSEVYLTGLENSNSLNAQFTSFLDCFNANITYSDIENLKITKYDQDISKIIFVDGLNEIPSEETRKKIVSLLNLIHREFGFKLVVVTRHFHSNEYRTFNSFRIEEVDADELKKILWSSFQKELFEYSAKNLKYLSLPFFLDIALRSRVDKITEYSNYIYAHVLKGIDPRFHDTYLNELSTLAYDAYQSKQKFIIPKSKITPVMEKKYVKNRILIQHGGGYEFEHQLVNEFLVAYKIRKNPLLWNDDEFDRITFEESKSFEIIQMILEQINDEKTAEQYLKAVYNWNFYAALHCLKYVDDTYSNEFARVITLILSEKLFDKFSHTRNRIVDSLYDLFIKFEIKGLEINQIQQILNLDAGLRKEKFDDIIAANRQYFIGGSYEHWYTIFSVAAVDPDPNDVAMIVNKDPLIGWSYSNVLKRNVFNDNLALQLMVLYAVVEDRTQKWRIVHALGSGNSEKTINFLFEILKKNEFTWVSFGTIRSILEIAMFTQRSMECEMTLNLLFEVLEIVLFDKIVIWELRACLTDKVENEKIVFITLFYDKIIASNHKNFEEKDLLESSKQKFIVANGIK